jgi:hypothetical protein
MKPVIQCTSTKLEAFFEKVWRGGLRLMDYTEEEIDILKDDPRTVDQFVEAMKVVMREGMRKQKQ